MFDWPSSSTWRHHASGVLSGHVFVELPHHQQGAIEGFRRRQRREGLVPTASDLHKLHELARGAREGPPEAGGRRDRTARAAPDGGHGAHGPTASGGHATAVEPRRGDHHGRWRAGGEQHRHRGARALRLRLRAAPHHGREVVEPLLQDAARDVEVRGHRV